MKVKKVSNAINELLEPFLDDLKEGGYDDIRKLIVNHGNVCGGAIPSALLDEEINDLDIYFDDEDVVYEIANHYTKIISDNIYSSGDVDAFIIDEGADELQFLGYGVLSDEVFDRLNSSMEYAPIFVTNNAITLDNGIQLVLKYHGSPDVVTDKFDFLHAKGIYRIKDRKLEISKETLLSIMDKNLIYTGSDYPIASMIRCRKFIRRDWNVSAGQIMKICFDINNLDLTSNEILREQLLGVDTVYARTVIEKMKRRDLSIDSDYAFNMIDEVFEDGYVF